MSLIINFSGDISFSGIFAEDRNNNFLAPPIIAFLARSDYNVLNIEGPLTTCGNIPKRGVSLTSHPLKVEIFRNFPGVIFNLANNHIMDAGTNGLKETKSIAQKLQIQTFGAGMNLKEASIPIVLEKDNIKVSLIAVCHPEGQLATDGDSGIFCDKQEKKLIEIIRQCKKHSDWIVLNYHGGEEFTRIPMPSRREKFNKYIESGVDVVVAHHPHVVQGYEKIRNGMVFFSLGNFIFDIPAHLPFDGTNESVIISIDFNKKDFSFDKIFTSISRESGEVNILHNNTNFFEIDQSHYKELWAIECRKVIGKKYKYIMNNEIVNSNQHILFLNKIPRKIQPLLKFLKFMLFIFIFSNPYQRKFFRGLTEDLISDIWNSKVRHK